MTRYLRHLVALGSTELTLHKQKLSWSEASSLYQSSGAYISIVNNIHLVNCHIEAISRFANQKGR
jgi:hypothetical protein